MQYATCVKMYDICALHIPQVIASGVGQPGVLSEADTDVHTESAEEKFSCSLSRSYTPLILI